MSGIEHLPQFDLSRRGPLGRAFVDLGFGSFGAAARHVWELPFGRTADATQFALVLSEGRGTCGAKHALLAALAREHQRPIELLLCIFEMTDANTPGVGAVLQEHGLTAIPEAHCCLRYQGQTVDLTHPPEASIADPIRPLSIAPIAPEQVGSDKRDAHRLAMVGWLCERPQVKYSLDELWAIRERCVAELANAGRSISEA